MTAVEKTIEVQVWRYIADDGNEFESQTECEKYERFHAAVIEALKIPMPAIPHQAWRKPERENLQHDAKTFETFRVAILNLGAQYASSPHSAGQFNDCLVNWHPCHPGEAASDPFLWRSGAWREAYFRLRCTDSAYREWQQQYYADRANAAMTAQDKKEAA